MGGYGMTREEQIKKIACALGQKYFPDEHNIWARENIEAKWVEFAVIEAVKWADKTMIDKACKWIENYVENAFTEVDGMMIELHGIELSEDFRKSMEE